MVRWKRDVIYGVAIIIFSIANYIYSLTLSEGTLKYTLAQPGPYLRMLMIVFAFLGVLLIINALVKKPSEILEPIFSRMATFALIMMVLFIFSMPYIGFIIAGLIFSLVTVIGFSYGAGRFFHEDGSRKKGKDLYKVLFKYILISLFITMITYFVFGNLLSVRLPKFNLF